MIIFIALNAQMRIWTISSNEMKFKGIFIWHIRTNSNNDDDDDDDCYATGFGWRYLN